jgi:predicted nucleic acid-binding protein
MNAEYFLDTNILIYRYSRQDDQKRIVAANLLESGNAAISAQVLNEFCNTTRKKFPQNFTHIEATLSGIQGLLTVHPLQANDTHTAIQISKRYGLSYYDSLILAVAENHSCKVVFSEDMQHEMTLDSGLQILNPFVL